MLTLLDLLLCNDSKDLMHQLEKKLGLEVVVVAAAVVVAVDVALVVEVAAVEEVEAADV